MKTYTINPLNFSRIPSTFDGELGFEMWAAQSILGRFRVSLEDGVWWAFDPQKKEWMKCGSFGQGVELCGEMLIQYLEADTLKEVSHGQQ